MALMHFRDEVKNLGFRHSLVDQEDPIRSGFNRRLDAVHGCFLGNRVYDRKKDVRTSKDSLQQVFILGHDISAICRTQLMSQRFEKRKSPKLCPVGFEISRLQRGIQAYRLVCSGADYQVGAVADSGEGEAAGEKAGSGTTPL